MEKSRRAFFKQGLAGALLLGAAPLVNAAPDPAKPKTAPAVNPFHLGMAGYTFVNFDLLRSKVLEFADVIQPGKESELLSVVKHNLRNRYGVATDEQLEAASSINVEAISYALQSPTFYFNGSNIVFYFNPYEIGPWAIGTVEVPVSVYELEGIISPEAKKLLNE